MKASPSKFRGPSRQRKLIRAATIAIAALGISIALADTLDPQIPSVAVRGGKGSMYAVVTEIAGGGQYQVIEQNPDGWMRVKVGDKDGYIRATTLTPQKSNALVSAAASANNLTGNAQASDAGASAAGRGLDSDTAIYAQAKGYNTDRLATMLANRQRVEGATWQAFAQQGKVGPYK